MTRDDCHLLKKKKGKHLGICQVLHLRHGAWFSLLCFTTTWVKTKESWKHCGLPVEYHSNTNNKIYEVSPRLLPLHTKEASLSFSHCWPQRKDLWMTREEPWRKDNFVFLNSPDEWGVVKGEALFLMVTTDVIATEYYSKKSQSLKPFSDAKRSRRM